MALVVGVQGLMTSSKCKKNMHKHTPITSTFTKKLASKTKKKIIANGQGFPNLLKV